ncbi:type II secretion system protein N [Brevundimonas lutea]|uniref:type II secretion system protein N n=1 Tax=Brevundimonas lutea TaxID=2293980 RepID=UPI0013CF1A90|nr:type II secretion system protein N [Brevundimonas lutea]
MFSALSQDQAWRLPTLSLPKRRVGGTVRILKFDRSTALRYAAVGGVITAQIAAVGWVMATPPSAPATSLTSAPPPTLPALQPSAGFDPFFRVGAQGALAEATASAGGALSLFGLRAGGEGGGSAIIGLPDGRQVSIAVGEAVEPGLILAEVGADHVVLARGASRSRLGFGQASVDAPARPTPPAPPTPATDQIVTPTSGGAVEAVDPKQALAAIGLQPREGGGQIVSGPQAMLGAAGLEAGDVILAIDDRPLNGRVSKAMLALRFAGRRSVELQIERDGRPLTLTAGLDRS